MLFIVQFPLILLSLVNQFRWRSVSITNYQKAWHVNSFHNFTALVLNLERTKQTLMFSKSFDVIFQVRLWGLDQISSPRSLIQSEAKPRTCIWRTWNYISNECVVQSKDWIYFDPVIGHELLKSLRYTHIVLPVSNLTKCPVTYWSR